MKSATSKTLSTYLRIRVSPAHKRKLQLRAAMERRDLSDLVRMILEEYVKNHNGQNAN